MLAEEALGVVAKTSQEAQSFNAGLREIGNNYHSAGKRLKMSCSSIPVILQSMTYQQKEEEEKGNALFNPG